MMFLLWRNIVKRRKAAETAIQKEPEMSRTRTTGYSKKGISLRTLYSRLIIIAVLISGLMVYSTFRLSSSFHKLSEATDEYIYLQKTATELMDASDYLTEKVQRFTINGDMQYLDDYFTEAFETNRREAAVAIMKEKPDCAAAFQQLQEALNASKALMQQEYYAMKLVIEAKEYTDYPDILRGVELSEADSGLSPSDKMRLATETVLNEEYYRQKDEIRSNMKESLSELEKLTHGASKASEKSLSSDLLAFRIIIALQTIGIVVMVWLTSRLGIRPVLKAVDKIKNDRPMPEVGANEFRYLAQEYNRMYTVYKKSVEHLNFTASHDALTQVYNRAGYDLLISGIDLSTTYILLFDIDDFKVINDTLGHEAGDSVLIKVANTLKNNFRADDYVCRIGGDEFVVFMLHSENANRSLIASIIDRINAALGKTDDGLPFVSISAGVTHGSEADDARAVLELADRALYDSKHNGKHCYTFSADKQKA